MLFTGFMLTPAGPKVLEYNVRFGDPETEALMLLLDDSTDLAAVLLVRRTLPSRRDWLNRVHLGMCRTPSGFCKHRHPTRFSRVCDPCLKWISGKLSQG